MVRYQSPVTKPSKMYGPNVDTGTVQKPRGEEIGTVLGPIGAIVPVQFSGKMEMRFKVG